MIPTRGVRHSKRQLPVRWITPAVTILLVCLAPGTLAQASSLSGRVVDSTGGVLPGVTVEAVASGVPPAVTVTGADGTYSLDLAEGMYDVAFQLINFATSVRRGVTVTSEAAARLDMTLYLAASADVVVTAKRTFRNLADLDEPVNHLIGVADAASQGVVTAKQIERRPFRRAGEILETVPGVVISQHSGEGKANQYYLRGFNLDHGTDVAITIAGVPINLPTHAHGHGYADTNVLIPELIGAVQYKKGPYYADEGDFASAGAVNVNYVNLLDRPIALLQGGNFGFARALYAASPVLAGGYLLYAVEASRNDGPWVRPDELQKVNTVLRFTKGNQRGGFSITATGYDASWNASDQIPGRAVAAGALTRFGLVDPTAGGETSRYTLSSEWQRNSSTSLTQASAYGIRYRLNLFSNFTYFLADPINGDQFEQADDRLSGGVKLSHRWLAKWGGAAVENVVGVQVRHDDIHDVALHRTRGRARLDTVRSDEVRQTGSGIHAQSSVQWQPWLRTVAGIRADDYRFDVSSDEPLNSGRGGASLLSPKLTVILAPRGSNTELYVNAGTGFHSNDARGATIRIDPASGEPADRVTPLVRARGAEIGMRTTPVQGLHAAAALWGLDLDSELLFVGDAGNTEASRPSRRTGVELSVFCKLNEWMALDADLAHSTARFRDFDPAGDRIPGAVEGVASLGAALIDFRRVSGELRYRYFGPRPLTEDNSVRSGASSLWNSRFGYRFNSRIRVDLDVFNLLDAKVSDIDYFYTSRLPGEPADGVDDVHFHPVERRSFRIAMTTSF